jgi:hypothetical protein
MQEGKSRPARDDQGTHSYNQSAHQPAPQPDSHPADRPSRQGADGEDVSDDESGLLAPDDKEKFFGGHRHVGTLYPDENDMDKAAMKRKAARSEKEAGDNPAGNPPTEPS